MVKLRKLSEGQYILTVPLQIVRAMDYNGGENFYFYIGAKRTLILKEVKKDTTGRGGKVL